MVCATSSGARFGREDHRFNLSHPIEQFLYSTNEHSLAQLPLRVCQLVAEYALRTFETTEDLPPQDLVCLFPKAPPMPKEPKFFIGHLVRVFIHAGPRRIDENSSLASHAGLNALMYSKDGWCDALEKLCNFTYVTKDRSEVIVIYNVALNIFEVLVRKYTDQANINKLLLQLCAWPLAILPKSEPAVAEVAAKITFLVRVMHANPFLEGVVVSAGIRTTTTPREAARKQGGAIEAAMKACCPEEPKPVVPAPASPKIEVVS